MSEVVVPESITTIGYQFYGYDSLTSIIIHSGVTSIGSGAFAGCSNLESVTFAEGSQLTSIGSRSFDGCSNLETIYYNGTEEQWIAIEKGVNWDLNCGNYEVVFLGDAGTEGGEG